MDVRSQWCQRMKRFHASRQQPSISFTVQMPKSRDQLLRDGYDITRQPSGALDSCQYNNTSFIHVPAILG